MALSRKQLRLVFAKLREKGLLKYLKKGRRHRMLYSEGLPSLPAETPGITEELTQRYVSRLPAGHRQRARLRRIEVAHEFDPSSGSWYNSKTQVLHVSSHPGMYTAPVGYSERPSFIPGGREPLTPSNYDYLSWKRQEKGEIGFSSDLRIRQWRQRNAKIGSAKAFYHEFAHSVDIRRSPDGKDVGAFSWGEPWKEITRKEWRLAVKEWFPAFSKNPARPFARSHSRHVPVSESFAEAYAQYATSKPSQMRLKRERPLSYKYMKKFFEEGQ